MKLGVSCQGLKKSKSFKIYIGEEPEVKKKSLHLFPYKDDFDSMAFTFDQKYTKEIKMYSQ